MEKIESKLDQILALLTNSEKQKQETLTLQIRLEQNKMNHERQMKIDVWNREDEQRERDDVQRAIDKREEEQKLKMAAKKLNPQPFAKVI